MALASRGGPATVGGHGLASALDSTAKGGTGSIAVTLRQNGTGASAQAGPFGVAIVHNHPALDPFSGPAVAIAESCSVAIAFDGNYVQGSKGALLIASYMRDDECRFAVGIVDDKSLLANQKYVANADGDLVAV